MKFRVQGLGLPGLEFKFWCGFRGLGALSKLSTAFQDSRCALNFQHANSIPVEGLNRVP